MCQERTAQNSIRMARVALYGRSELRKLEDEAEEAESPPDCLEGNRAGNPAAVRTTTNLTVCYPVGGDRSLV